MTFLDSLEKKYGKYVPENLTYYLVIGQIIAYVVAYLYPQYHGIFALRGNLVLAGEWWRLILFVFTPAGDSLIWVAFAWYMFYFFGIGLEKHWGAFRYLTYLLIAYLGVILCSFLFPLQTIVGTYVFLSVFLSFAYLYPDVQLMIFFIIPVKVKWLGVLAWVVAGSTLLLGSFPSKILTIAAIANFFVFFGRDLLRSYRMQKSPVITPVSWDTPGVKNICAVCGKYEMEHRDLDFRYCTDCNPITCYCEEHLEHHRHKKTRLVH